MINIGEHTVEVITGLDPDEARGEIGRQVRDEEYQSHPEKKTQHKAGY
jgi:hypothetical protein